MKYSIIVCAYNASKRIGNTLRHLAALDYPADKVEVIVIDNASTDGTGEHAFQVWQSMNSKIGFNLFKEPRPGKSFALWRGFKAAKGDYCIVCDDDNWLNPDYLTIADQTFEAIGSNVVLGGAAMPHPELPWEELPAFVFSYGGYLALGCLSLELEDVTVSKGWLMGAGCIFPKESIDDLLRVGFQQTLTCRNGDKLSTGGDVEMCYALTLMGWRLYSQPALKFRHFIPESRMKLEYIKELMKANEKAYPSLYPYIRLRQLLFHKSKIRRCISAMIDFVRRPSGLSQEALRFSVFGKFGKFEQLPVYLLATESIGTKSKISLG
jgi:glycosyltransferase involved in cell wall biosynthesis